MEDRKENEMPIVDSVDYLRGMKGKDSVLINIEDIANNAGIQQLGYYPLKGGIETEIPNSNVPCLACIYVSSVDYDVGLAIIDAGTTGFIFRESKSASFFDKSKSKVVLYRKDVKGPLFIISNIGNATVRLFLIYLP